MDVLKICALTLILLFLFLIDYKIDLVLKEVRKVPLCEEVNLGEKDYDTVDKFNSTITIKCKGENDGGTTQKSKPN